MDTVVGINLTRKDVLVDMNAFEELCCTTEKKRSELEVYWITVGL